MAEASFEQARQTFEKFLSSAHQATGSFEDRGAAARTNAREIGSKAVAYAEKNVQASLDYAQSLLKAKDLTEVMRLHSEYVQGQMRSLAEQAVRWARSSAAPQWMRRSPRLEEGPQEEGPEGHRLFEGRALGLHSTLKVL